MKKQYLGLLAIGLCALSSMASAAESPFTGHWSLDLSRSTFPDGKIPAGETAFFQNTEHQEYLSAAVEMKKGSPSESVYVAIFDGKIYPAHNVTKNKPSGGVTVRVIDANHEEKKSYDDAGKYRSKIEREVSPDGQTLVSAIYGADGKLTSRRVFAKQP